MDLHHHHWPGDKDRPGLALHCLMGSGAGWRHVAKALDQRLDLRGFDMPGHGRSPDWQPTDDGVDYITAVTRYAAALIDRPLDLIGHSFGAVVALRIAVAAPDAIRTLTLIEPVLFAAAPDLDELSHAAMAPFVQSGDWAGAAQAFLSIWGYGVDLDTLPVSARAQMISQVRLIAETGPALSHDSAKILRPDGLESIDAPVLFVMGEKSPAIVHALVDQLAVRMADVGRAVVPDAGHMVPMTHPDQVAGLIGVNLDRA